MMDTLAEVKKHWRDKMTKLRDERDWLNKHEFKIEAMVKTQVIDALWNILYDLDNLEE